MTSVTEVRALRGHLGRRAWAYLWEGRDTVFVVIDEQYTADESARITGLVDLLVNRRSELSPEA